MLPEISILSTLGFFFNLKRKEGWRRGGVMRRESHLTYSYYHFKTVFLALTKFCLLLDSIS
jgi:hypothetical protein